MLFNWIVILKFVTSKDRKYITPKELVSDPFRATCLLYKGEILSVKSIKKFITIRQRKDVTDKKV